MNEVRSKGRFGIWLSILIPSVLVFVCIVLELVLAQPVYAAVFHIASGDVAGLINAINTANSNGQDNTINLAAGTYALTAVDNDTDGPNGLPSITGKISIKGAGANTTSIERGTSIAGPLRMFHIAATGALTLDGISITGGSAPFCESFPFGLGGGGILNNGGTLDISNSTISGNDASFCSGGGIINANEGAATITNSAISNNAAGEGNCGGIENEGPMIITNSIIDDNQAAFDAGICNGSVMTINHSTISSNRVDEPGGTNGGIVNGGDMTITDSTIAGNGSGALVSQNTAGGIVNGGNLIITNSTVANNGGDKENGGIANGGHLQIVNSTVVNNTSDSSDHPGGIFNSIGGTVQLQNSIVALNTAVDVSFNQVNSDCSGQVTSAGNNIIGDTTGCTITLLATDLTGDPGLDTFTDNGSPGNGHFPLLSNSQAINAGNNKVCRSNPILHTDQIGDPRVGICDIGSIEFEPFESLGDCISTLIKQNCSGLQGTSLGACIKEQQTFCSNLFKSK